MGSSPGSGTGSDIATIKYDTNGNELWVRRYNSPDNPGDAAYDIEVDASGNVIVSGWPCTIKYDQNGDELWIRPNLESPDQAFVVYDLEIDNFGNVYGAGALGAGAYWDFGTTKFDTDGNQLWIARWDGPPQYDLEYATAVAVDSEENVLIAGWGYEHSTVIKYDTDGNALWIATEMWPRCQYPTDIEVDSAGNVYVAGEVEFIKHDSSGEEMWVVPMVDESGIFGAEEIVCAFGSIYLAGGVHVQGQSSNMALVKYDMNGNQIWALNYNSPANKSDHANSLAVDHIGNVLVSGNSVNESGNYDYYTLKYSQELTPNEKVYGLIDAVTTLTEEGRLLPDKSEGLIAKLEEALKNLTKDNPNERVACNKLSDFIDQVNSCIPSGAIPDPVDGWALIDTASVIMAELCG